MKKVPALLLAFVFPSLLYGQYKNFDLSKYKLPDIKTDRLDAYFDITNNFINERSESSDSTDTRFSNKNFDGSLNLDYYHFRNKEKYQGSLNAGVFLNSSPNSAESINYSSKSGHNHGSIHISSINRLYDQKLNFIGIDPEITFMGHAESYNYESVNNPNRSDDNNQYMSKISLPVSIGHGRIEPIEDLRLAIYILEELDKVGRIENMPSENVVLEMAKEISKIKRKRFFDTRVKKISELQAIDSFLLANDIVSVKDITYFAVLNDQWDFASGPSRSAGFSVNAGIDDGIVLNRFSDKTTVDGEIADESKSSINTYNFGPYVQMIYSRPLNLYWQTSATFGTSYVFEFTRNRKDMNNSEENYRTNIFNTNLTYSIQFLPNSRTSLGLNLEGDYKNSKRDGILSDQDPLDIQMKDNQFTLNVRFNMYYYISPRLRLQTIFNLTDYKHLNLDYNNPDIKIQTTSLHNNLSFNLIYSFF